MTEEARCDFYDRCQEERVDSAKFKAKVLEKLSNIERSIEEIKADGKGDIDNIWGAIGSIRDDIKKIKDDMFVDIKNLYWRIGLLSGGVSLTTSLVVSVVVALIMLKKGGG